jgi:uncharacterized protein (TIGR02145 family)
MKTTIVLFGLCILLISSKTLGQVGINHSGAAPDPSAGLDVEFSDRGLLMPRLTSAERDAISNPAEGLLIYNTTTGCFNFMKGASWFEWCGTQVLPPCSSLTDSRDGQTYSLVEIGTQCWMAENLNYSTGTNWCFDNNPSNCVTYGRLYDWHTAISACPDGWHLPSDSEWQVLVDYLGGDAVAGGKMKTVSGWSTPNAGATNESGFSALPGGNRLGNFNELGIQGYWWTGTAVDADFAWYRSIYYGLTGVGRTDYYKTAGFSCRCVKD